MDEAQLTLIGRVKNIIFQNVQNFFKIMAVTVTTTSFDWKEKEIIVTGSFGDIKEETQYQFVGHLVNHPRYGQQFAADNYHTDQPTSKQGLVSYLSSDKFPGIGEKTAERIIDALGINAIDQILKDPSVLKPLRLGAQKQAMLVDNLKANLGMEQVIIGLNEFGLTSAMAAKIYSLYATDALQVIEDNPYQLIADVEGIGFKRADAIAAKMNIQADAPTRIQGAILDTLARLTDGEGDTYVLLPDLVNATIELLESARNVAIEPDAVAEAMITLGHKNELIAEEQRVYPKRLHDAEWQIANRLHLLTDKPEKLSETKVSQAIDQVAEAAKLSYDATQRDAIATALSAPLFLLTGGPGTGKTTVINGIVRSWAMLHDVSLDVNQYKDKPFPIMLAAPTGRAAKRMTETTTLPASTIHRLLGLAVDTQDFEPNDLPEGLLIIDEMSMVDTYLFRTLLTALHPGIKLILVGDKDQLPSVGPGQVFADLLSSNTLPKVELTHIHRQDGDSSIIPLAHAINAGQLPADWQRPQGDRSFILCPPEQLGQAVGQVIQKAARRFSPAAIQVLAPMYRGNAGIDSLNPLIQGLLNPKKSTATKEVRYGETVYRIGDKVLQLVNNPENNVYNGEIGRITSLTLAKQAESKTDELVIDFDGNEITYPKSDWSKFTLAYATSIHKAQGSEFDVVILPLTLQSRRMLRRNLLYTAVTRAKQFLILLGDPRAFELAVSEMAVNRHTSLVARLQQVIGGQVEEATPKRVENATAEPAEVTEQTDAKPPEPASPPANYRLTTALVRSQSIDPMIGMSGVTLG